MQKGLDSYQTPAKVEIIATRDLPDAGMLYLPCPGCGGHRTQILEGFWQAGLDNESRKNVLLLVTLITQVCVQQVISTKATSSTCENLDGLMNEAVVSNTEWKTND